MTEGKRLSHQERPPDDKQEDVRSRPSPAENEAPDDKGEEEIEEYGSRTDDPNH